MPVLWPGLRPPTENAPIDVPESGEEAGVEEERTFTTDEVAMLLNVPLDTIDQWHQEGTGPPGYQTYKESHCQRSDIVRWWRSRSIARFLPERLRWELRGRCVHDGGGLAESDNKGVAANRGALARPL
jgi:hypothetical protein